MFLSNLIIFLTFVFMLIISKSNQTIIGNHGLNDYRSIFSKIKCRVRLTDVASVDAINKYIANKNTACNLTIEFKHRKILDMFLKSADGVLRFLPQVQFHQVKGFFLSANYETNRIWFGKLIFYRFYLDFYDKNANVIVKKPNDDKYSLRLLFESVLW